MGRKEGLTIENIVFDGLQRGLTRQQIAEKNNLTQRQVGGGILHLRRKLRIKPPFDQAYQSGIDPEVVRQILDNSSGRVPFEAIKANLKVWPIVKPLAERGALPATIIEITGLKDRQVYSALDARNRRIAPVSAYFLPESVQRRRHLASIRGRETRKGLLRQDQYEQGINALARRILEFNLIPDLSDKDALVSEFEAVGRQIRSVSREVVLEAVFRCARLVRQGDVGMTKLYPRLLKELDGVLYRKEDLIDLRIAKRRPRVTNL